jgi:hypothetical protein
LSYSGHALDWLFVGLFATPTVFWFRRTHSRLTLRLAAPLLVGALAAQALAAVLQSVSNAVFDPLFLP